MRLRIIASAIMILGLIGAAYAFRRLDRYATEFTRKRK